MLYKKFFIIYYFNVSLVLLATVLIMCQTSVEPASVLSVHLSSYSIHSCQRNWQRN